jgi:hypothetical protein
MLGLNEGIVMQICHLSFDGKQARPRELHMTGDPYFGVLYRYV